MTVTLQNVELDAMETANRQRIIDLTLQGAQIFTDPDFVLIKVMLAHLLGDDDEVRECRTKAAYSVAEGLDEAESGIAKLRQRAILEGKL